MTGRCRHCRRVLSLHARGLCFRCRAEPGLRALYPSRVKADDMADCHATSATLELLCAAVHRPSGLFLDEWRAVLAVLPARQRRVVVLTVYWGLSQAQIAERLGVSRGRVNQLWLTALRRVRASAVAANFPLHLDPTRNVS